ncbi:portal protein [Microvirga sp. TS319]|uniref:portal protein n=1 Tax=Microvirga sp. TS319 TaxID=3241165 RepID=UPI00351A573C
MMADDKIETAKDSEPDGADFMKEARDRYERGLQRERDNIDEAYEDLAFRVGEQWDAEAKRARKDRPCLTINRIPQFVRQVTGDMRQMRPAIRVVPVDARGDPETAETQAGMIRYIENRSDAPAAYFQAADSQVAAGAGAWRVLTEYADDSTFNQEIRIAPVEDPIAIVWDPDAVQPTREDAQFCFVPVDMSRAAFEAKYPGASQESFQGTQHTATFSGWFADDYVRVAEYWYKKPATRLLLQMPDGAVDDLTDASPEDIRQAQEIVAFIEARGEFARLERRDSYVVCRAVISASEVLEDSTEWPGRYIPIVPVWGEEIRIGRRIVRHGVVRYAKDPQRMYNYFRSAQTEIVALQPKAPFIGTEKQFEQYQDIWETANTVNHPYLVYAPDGNAPPPSRVQPPVSSQGVDAGVALAAEDMKAVTGIYDASLGNRSNESSGRAILARQQEGDTGTYVYIDNFARAIRHTGKILIDLIPKVYDTARTIRILGEDGKVDVVEINQPFGMDEGGKPIIKNDVTVGAYDVVLEMGPSYNTKRREAKDGMTAFIQSAPGAAPLILDLIAKAQDWPNATEIAERLEVMLPPPVKALKAEKEGKPLPPEMQPPQPGPMDELELQAKQADVEAKKAQARKAIAEADKAEIELFQAQAIMGPGVMQPGGPPPAPPLEPMLPSPQPAMPEMMPQQPPSGGSLVGLETPEQAPPV